MKNRFILYFFSLCFISCSYRYRQKYENMSMQKLNVTIKAIENLYVDTIDKNKLINDVIVSLFQKLDPHSSYMNSEETKEMNKSLQGNFNGIGIQFSQLINCLYVIQVIPSSPSEKVGIMAGDRIMSINDTLISEIKDTDIMKRLQGHKGTVVNLTIIRKSNSNPITFKIIRNKISISSLDAFYMISKKNGYIRLNRFASTSYDEFKTALKILQSNGLKNLIVDLQDNGGGYLQAAIDIASQFLKKNDLIVYTKGVHQKQENAYVKNDGIFLNGKMIVLINESTASASEIVAGALQDWDRAVIVGSRSFGKGLVQRPILFNDGSMIKLTTARYYTPTGRSIQKKYENIKFYDKDLINCSDSVKKLTSDSICSNYSIKYTLINKRIVYGGGGIMPDYFITTDTNQYTYMYYYLVTSKIFNEYIANYIDKNRNYIRSKYNNIHAYKAQFNVSNTLLSSLLEIFQKHIETLNNEKCVNFSLPNCSEQLKNKKKIIPNFQTSEYIEQFKKSKLLIKLQIKALIARSIWGLTGYYKVINDKNDALQKAIEILNNNEVYGKLLKIKK